MVELYESATSRFGAHVPRRKHQKWFGWQGLNLRGHAPKTFFVATTGVPCTQ